MAFSGKHWKILNEDSELSVVQKLLSNRKIEGEEATEAFLNPDIEQMHDPFLMKDMDKAVARIERAISDNERIIIFGDYDADGVTGTAIMYHALKQLGAEVSYRLPHRVNDGYGMSEKFVADFAEAGAKLVVTVDCGIACKDSIALCAERGIDVIVTDHHTIPEALPDRAVAILHPKQRDCGYPFNELTGAGVALKLAKALFLRLSPEVYRQRLEELLDLATIGTVADIGPLIGENRVIVRHGLMRMANTKWPGLARLQESAGVSGKPLDTVSIGFHLAPRLNAAGRLSTPYHALHVLIESDEKAGKLVKKLETLNRERQNMTREAFAEASAMAQAQIKDRSAIVIRGKWHIGIVGLIAGKLAGEFNRPAIVAAESPDGILVGSVRSPEFFSVIDALNENRQYFTHYGGHAQAGGFSMHPSQFVPMQIHLWHYAERLTRGREFHSELLIDCALCENDLSEKLWHDVAAFQPFGVLNCEPVFLLRNVRISHPRAVGTEKKHLKMQAACGEYTFGAIGFNLASAISELSSAPVDLACNLRTNVWRGTVSHELNVVDFARCS